MAIAEIKLKEAAGPVTVRVEDQRHPQGIAAVVWCFNQANQLDPKTPVAQIEKGKAEVPLGAAETIQDKTFLIDGFVIPFMDSLPTIFQIFVTVYQGGVEVHKVIPDDNGTGKISNTQIRFRYP